MSHEKYKKELTCPKCGAIGAIYVLKLSNDEALLKQRCPDHGARKYKIPTKIIQNLYPEIADAIHRCYYCGDKIDPNHIKQSDPWTLIKGDCKLHRKKLPYQKIWASTYSELEELGILSQVRDKSNNGSLDMINCPNCGTKFRKKPDQDFCEFCMKKV